MTTVNTFDSQRIRNSLNLVNTFFRKQRSTERYICPIILKISIPILWSYYLKGCVFRCRSRSETDALVVYTPCKNLPEVFYRVEIRRLGWPDQYLDSCWFSQAFSALEVCIVASSCWNMKSLHISGAQMTTGIQIKCLYIPKNPGWSPWCAAGFFHDGKMPPHHDSIPSIWTDGKHLLLPAKVMPIVVPPLRTSIIFIRDDLVSFHLSGPNCIAWNAIFF